MPGDLEYSYYPDNEIDGGEGDDTIFGVAIEKEMVLRGGLGNDIIFAGGWSSDKSSDYGDIAYDDDYDGQIFVYGGDGHDKLYGADSVPF